jgi:methyl-accepting chemotaxis protein
MGTSVQQTASRKNAFDHPQTGIPEQPVGDYLVAILESLQTMKKGDFSVRLPVSWTGLPGKVADNFNEIVTANERMAFELKRAGQAVGKESKTRERIRV